MELRLNKIIAFWLFPLLLLGIWQSRGIIFPFIIGVFLGFAIQTIALFVSYKTRINYYFNVLVIYLALIFIISLGIYLAINVFIEQLPSLWNKIFPYIKNFPIKEFKVDKDLQKFILNLGSSYLNSVFPLMQKIFNGLFYIIFILIVSLYTALSKNVSDKIALFFKEDKREEYIKIFLKIKRKISFWFFGQIILMIIVGLLTYIFMLVLKIPYASLIALTSGILEIIPILGPIISLLIASAITLVEKQEMIFLVIGSFILIQQVENHFLVPLIMKKATDINPLFVILGVLIGGQIGGILGIIIILPLMGILIEIFNFYFYNNKNYNPGSSNK